MSRSRRHGKPCYDGCTCKRHLVNSWVSHSRCADNCKCKKHVPSWNSGLTAKDDSRLTKIGAKIRRTLIGRHLPAEHKASISRGMLKVYAEGRYTRTVEYNRLPTRLEYALQMLLESADFEFEAQKRIGRYVVDAYIENSNLVFEADGQFWYWHQDKEREIKRDESLLKAGIAAVIHLTDEDLDPWIPQVSEYR